MQAGAGVLQLLAYQGLIITAVMRASASRCSTSAAFMRLPFLYMYDDIVDMPHTGPTYPTGLGNAVQSGI